MKARESRLHVLAIAGGHAIALALAFLPDVTFLFGAAGTRAIVGASIVAMIPLIVSELVDGFRESGAWGLLGEAGSAIMAAAAFALALFLLHPEPGATGGIEAMAYALPVFVLHAAYLSDRPRATHADPSGRH